MKRLALMAMALLSTVGALAPAPSSAVESERQRPLSWPARRFSPCGAFDTDTRQLIVFGGRNEGGTAHLDDAWALDAGAPRPRWRQLTPSGASNAPPPVRSCAAAYDPAGRRLIVFGGTGAAGSTNGVWALALDGAPAWTQLCDAASCGPAPAARRSLQASYDPVRDRLVLFGGLGGTFRDDLWYLHLDGEPRWEEVPKAGAWPTGRAGHAQVFDADRDVVWLMGGTRTGPDLNDLWQLDPDTSTWTLVAPDGCGEPCPSARSGHSMVLDQANDQLVVWGGFDSDDASFPDDLHTLTDLDTTPAWSAVTPASATPQPRQFAVASYDAAAQRMLMFGSGLGTSAYKDTAALHLPRNPAEPFWRGVAPATPVTARDQVMLHAEPIYGRLYAFGGFGAGTFPGAPDAGVHLAETRMLDLFDAAAGHAHWRDATPRQPDEIPLSREASATASDADGHQWFVIGGLSGDLPTNDVWVADVGPRLRPSWRQLCSATSCGESPPARWGAHAVYDPARDRVVLFGGIDGDGFTFADTWVLELGPDPKWHRLDIAGDRPGPRWGGAAGYDPIHQRMVVFGGQDAPDAIATSYDDTWVLDLTGEPDWRRVAGPGPSARRSPAYTTRPRATDLVVTGGLHPETGQHHNDVWRLDLAGDEPRWELLAPDGAAGAPEPRRSHSAAWDPIAGHVIVVFGRDADQFYGDVWTFDLADRQWSPVR